MTINWFGQCVRLVCLDDAPLLLLLDYPPHGITTNPLQFVAGFRVFRVVAFNYTDSGRTYKMNNNKNNNNERITTQRQTGTIYSLHKTIMGPTTNMGRTTQ